jgi:hypothetical protein
MRRQIRRPRDKVLPLLCRSDEEFSADEWASERDEAMPVVLAAEEAASSRAVATSERQMRMRFCVEAEMFDLCAAMAQFVL